MPDERKLYCRYLHISDLHLIPNAENDFGIDTILYGSKGKNGSATNIDEGGLRWYIKRNPVDCIVITGDFLLQGKSDEDTQKKLENALREIYDVCNKACSWNWDESKHMDRLFWCPGNHDLNRNAATFYPGEDVPVSREEKLSNAAQNEFFSPENTDDYKLLTLATFHKIYDLMKGLGANPVAEAAPPISPDRSLKLSDFKYEAQLFRVLNSVCSDPPVYFLAINTALSAGQTLADDDVNQKIEKAYGSFSKFHNAHESGNALEVYKEYDRLLQIKNRQVISDEGKLCFISNECVCALENKLNSESECIVILIGHHPPDFFTPNAELQFNKFARKNQICLYLHGHTHIIQNGTGTENVSHLSSQRSTLRHIGVGGLYLNSQDTYNQLSFSVGSIYRNGSSFTHESTILHYTPSSYGNQQWSSIMSPICDTLSPRIAATAFSTGSSENEKLESITNPNQPIDGTSYGSSPTRPSEKEGNSTFSKGSLCHSREWLKDFLEKNTYNE